MIIADRTINRTIINYDTSRFDFRAWASLILNVDCLEKIHEQAEAKLSSNALEQGRIFRSRLIAGFERFKPVYVYFIRSVIAPICGGVHSYQVPPTFRCHLSHKGTRVFQDKSDGGNRPDCLNVWIPFTRTWGTNSIWIESENGKGDFSPVELEYGQALIFDGNSLRHGTFLNTTHSSRISMEFRFSPSKAGREKKRSCAARVPLDI
jgi:hypothetical protein